MHQKPGGKSYQWQGQKESELDMIDILLKKKKKRERKRISIALILYQFGETRYLARPAKFNLHLKLLRWQIRDNFHIIRDTCREMDVQKKKESASVHS